MRTIGLESGFSCRVAVGEDDLRRVMALRYQVYCEEFRYLDPDAYLDGIERDTFDDHALHLIVSNGTDDVVGTLRLVLPSALGLPTQDYFPYLSIDGDNTVAELSRLIVAAPYRGHTKEVLISLAIAVYQQSLKFGLNGWICTMFVPTWWLFRRLGFPFHISGEIATWPRGSDHLVIPASMNFDEAAAFLREYQPELYRRFVPADDQSKLNHNPVDLTQLYNELAQEEATVRQVMGSRRTFRAATSVIAAQS